MVSAFVGGVVCIAGISVYHNNNLQGTLAVATAVSTLEMYLGGLNFNGALGYSPVVDMQAFAVYNRVLSPSEVALVTKQVTYCHVNNDWNAWGRQQQYWYYAPTFQASWVIQANTLLGGEQH